MTDASGIHVRFDKDSRIKILSSELSDHSGALNRETSHFILKTNEFKHAVEKVMTQVRKGSEVAEIEKLKAIGQRNRVENEREDRDRKKASLQSHLKDRQMHLDRYNAQYRSLLGAVSAQRVRIEKLQKC